jgi:putative hydrolase of the HAD superfamily
MKIAAVTFDVGGTLIEPWPSVGHVYAEAAARRGFNGISVEVLNRQFAAAWRGMRDFDYTESSWAKVVDATFRGLTEALPSQTFFPKLYQQFSEPDAWHIFDDVLATLEHLASDGLRLGIISNWDDRLRPLLAALKLDKYFEVILISCESAFTKPSPVMFNLAAEKLGVAPERVLHVGDSLELDVRGAQAAGMKAVLLRRSDAAAGDGEISSLHEVQVRFLDKKQ